MEEEEVSNGYEDAGISTLLARIKDCSERKDLFQGNKIHLELSRRKGLLKKNFYISGALVNMYVKCGALIKAQEVFEELSIRNVISWTALIVGYTEECHGNRGLQCFERMKSEGISPDSITLACILKACGTLRAPHKGQEIHAVIVKEQINEGKGKANIGNVLIDMYAKCGLLQKAKEVFDEIPVCSVVSWTSLIGGYLQCGHGEEALDMFRRMQLEALFPDVITLACILKACSISKALEKGQEIHVDIISRKLVESDIVLGNALIDMYSKCDELAKAQDVFQNLPSRDLVSWSALINGYTQHACSEEALKWFKEMLREGLRPDGVILACILKACGSIKAIREGQEIHAKMVREGLIPTRDVVLVGNALIDMYAKCDLITKSQEVFEQLQYRDKISWNTLIVGYVEHNGGEEALKCFEHMQLEGFSADEVTFTCILKACGDIECAEKGWEMHSEIVKQGLLENTVVGTALIEMYTSCGLLLEADDVFHKMPIQDVVAWTALLSGYAQLGKEDNFIALFDKMIREGKEPDTITSTVMLTTCSRFGRLQEAQSYFETMSRGDHGVLPCMEHYSCMIDLFGRAGHLQKALQTVKEMPFSTNLTIWHTLMASCQKWGNVMIGRLAFEHILRIDDKDMGAYVCMYNMYVAAGMHADADKIEEMRLRVSRDGIVLHRK